MTNIISPPIRYRFVTNLSWFKVFKYYHILTVSPFFMQSKAREDSSKRKAKAVESKAIRDGRKPDSGKKAKQN